MQLLHRHTPLHTRDHAHSETAFVVLDLETTGLSPHDSYIAEVALISLDERGMAISEWSTLVRPPGDNELGASQIHGITRAMVTGAPRFEEIADEMLERISNAIIVGHVVAFDIGHLEAAFERIERPLPDVRSITLCTRDLARRAWEFRPLTLENCCAQLNIPIIDAHSALGDTRATAELFRILLPAIPERVLLAQRVETVRVANALRAMAVSPAVAPGPPKSSRARPRTSG